MHKQVEQQTDASLPPSPPSKINTFKKYFKESYRAGRGKDLWVISMRQEEEVESIAMGDGRASLWGWSQHECLSLVTGK